MPIGLRTSLICLVDRIRLVLEATFITALINRYVIFCSMNFRTLRLGSGGRSRRWQTSCFRATWKKELELSLPTPNNRSMAGEEGAQNYRSESVSIMG